jgi:hypothetical protein
MQDCLRKGSVAIETKLEKIQKLKKNPQPDING